jgi:small-conductance mechanosensitive channel
MMNISQINSAIIQGDFTNVQLNSIIDAVKFARARLSESTKRELSIGDNVNFTSTKTGQNVTGVVTKIAIKYVTVRTVQGLWKVPANMLSKIEDREFA